MMCVCCMLLDMGPTLNYGYYSQQKPIVKFTLHAITQNFAWLVHVAHLYNFIYSSFLLYLEDILSLYSSILSGSYNISDSYCAYIL